MLMMPMPRSSPSLPLIAGAGICLVLCKYGGRIATCVADIGSCMVERLCYEILCQAQRYEAYCRPKRIIIIRHGESEGNIDKSLFGTKPDPFHSLTPHGVEQAREAGRAIRRLVGEESVYFQVSPYRRTRQTLQHILEAFDIDKSGSDIKRLQTEFKFEFPGWLSQQPLTPHGGEGASERKRFFFGGGGSGGSVETEPDSDLGGGVDDGGTTLSSHGGEGNEGGGGGMEASDVPMPMPTAPINSSRRRLSGGGHSGLGLPQSAENPGLGLSQSAETFLRTHSATVAKMLCSASEKSFVWPTTSKYKVREDARLREQEFGNFQDETVMSVSYKERRKYGPFWYRFKGGESGGDVWDRVSDWWSSIYREFTRHRYDNFVVVTHGLTMRNICMYYFKWTVEEFNLVLNPDNCEYWLLEKNPSRVYRLVSQVPTIGNEPLPLHMRCLRVSGATDNN